MKVPESRWWILAPLAAMVAIQIASGLPNPSHVSAEDGFSSLKISAARVLFAPGETAVNLFHAPVFAVLAWLWCWALAAWTRSRRARLLVAAAVCPAFGVVNELSQLFVPTRTASLGDVVADALGVAVGLGAVILIGRDPRTQ